jgi:conjugal transfer pilus assembly protein TraF
MATIVSKKTSMTVFLFLISLSTAFPSYADRYYTDSDRPGYWWGNDPPEKVEEKPEDPQKPKRQQPEEQKPAESKKYEWESRKELKYSDFTPQQVWDMEPKEMSALIDAFKDQSVRTLKEDHVHDLYRMMDMGRRKAVAFTNVQQMVVNKYPDVSMEHDTSLNPPGQDAIKQMKQDEVKQRIASARNEYGLIYFYKPNCPYCEAEEKVLQYFHDSRHFEIKPVNIQENPNLASMFNVTITPTLILVQKGSEGYQPISYGVISLDELDYRVFSTIRLMEGQIQPEQYGVREYERGGAYDPLAPLNKELSNSSGRKKSTTRGQ